MAREQLGEHVRHRGAVLDDVRDARRRPQVVLEHAEAPVGAAHRSMPATCTRTPFAVVTPRHGTVVVARRHHEGSGHDAGAEDLAGPVDVGEEGLERPHPLAYAGLDRLPLGRAEDPRDEVERERPLLARERERDALVAKGVVARGAALLEVGVATRSGVPVERAVVLASAPRRREHLVERVAQVVVVQEIADDVLLLIAPVSGWLRRVNALRVRKNTMPMSANTRMWPS